MSIVILPVIVLAIIAALAVKRVIEKLGPKFKVGDLICRAGLERWEHRDVLLILEVGKKKYRVQYANSGWNGLVTDRDIDWDNIYELYTGPRDELEFK